MSTGSAPGPDGLPTDYYCAFLPDWGTVLVRVFNTILMDDHVPPSFHSGQLVLLSKDPLRLSDPDAWRPISLLNSDYKLFASIVVRRLRPLLPSLVSPLQTCSIPGRDILAALSLVRDLLAYARSREVNGVVLSLDQRKAFDFLEHGYLFEVLEAYRFPAPFVHMLRLLYDGLHTTLILSSQRTDPFPVTRGVRQGCPLSPLLYVLCLEPFLRRVSVCPRVRGFPLPGVGVCLNYSVRRRRFHLCKGLREHRSYPRGVLALRRPFRSIPQHRQEPGPSHRFLQWYTPAWNPHCPADDHTRHCF